MNVLSTLVPVVDVPPWSGMTMPSLIDPLGFEEDVDVEACWCSAVASAIAPLLMLNLLQLLCCCFSPSMLMPILTALVNFEPEETKEKHLSSCPSSGSSFRLDCSVFDTTIFFYKWIWNNNRFYIINIVLILIITFVIDES